ncbi:TetR family transcriptional regulator [Gemmatirosa kalamazoonensis]|uniref:TetR family transcriptional regulator n=1 Tax=Gemmatirosa kalamazoonensis TaxID=861299 RepID=W0RE08_9BACT|nr:TetR family transcriptional regulator [Gemmatirosa kalamazoonensis]
MAAVLRRGIARGALRADADVTLALELLAGPLFYRYLWLGTPIDEPYVRAVVAAVLDHLMPRARGAPGGSNAPDP